MATSQIQNQYTPNIQFGVNPPHYRLDLTCAYLQLSPATVYRLTADGLISKVKIGKRASAWTRESLDKYLTDCGVNV